MTGLDELGAPKALGSGQWRTWASPASSLAALAISGTSGSVCSKRASRDCGQVKGPPREPPSCCILSATRVVCCCLAKPRTPGECETGRASSRGAFCRWGRCRQPGHPAPPLPSAACVWLPQANAVCGGAGLLYGQAGPGRQGEQLNQRVQTGRSADTATASALCASGRHARAPKPKPKGALPTSEALRIHSPRLSPPRQVAAVRDGEH